VVVATELSDTAYRNSCLAQTKGRRNETVLKKNEVKHSLGGGVSMYCINGVRLHIYVCIRRHRPEQWKNCEDIPAYLQHNSVHQAILMRNRISLCI
jgi:hypothetical protein